MVDKFQTTTFLAMARDVVVARRYGTIGTIGIAKLTKLRSKQTIYIYTLYKET